MISFPIRCRSAGHSFWYSPELSPPQKVLEKMEGLRVADALTEIFALFKRCNKYIDETQPWVLAKEEEKEDTQRKEAADTEAGAAQLIAMGDKAFGEGDYEGAKVYYTMAIHPPY